MSIRNSFLKWWYFKVRNTIEWKGEKGGFKVIFRRFSLEISSLSGNFKAVWAADEYPYGYLLTAVNGGNAETLWGFCERIYAWSKCLLREQQLVSDFDGAFERYVKRVESEPQEPFVLDTETEERIILEGEKEAQRLSELRGKERRKAERDINARFRNTARNLQKREKK